MKIVMDKKMKGVQVGVLNLGTVFESENAGIYMKIAGRDGTARCLCLQSANIDGAITPYTLTDFDNHKLVFPKDAVLNLSARP